MGIKEWFMDRSVRKMSKEEKQSMMNTMKDKFFASMSVAEKKEMMNTRMPKMMEKMFEGMSSKDKQELMMAMMPKMMEGMDMSAMMPQMMEKMMWSEGGMPFMMRQMMKSMMGGGKEGEKGQPCPMPVMETQKDFKPWECCPCRKLCEVGFKKNPNKDEKKGDE